LSLNNVEVTSEEFNIPDYNIPGKLVPPVTFALSGTIAGDDAEVQYYDGGGWVTFLTLDSADPIQIIHSPIDRCRVFKAASANDLGVLLFW